MEFKASKHHKCLGILP